MKATIHTWCDVTTAALYQGLLFPTTSSHLVWDFGTTGVCSFCYNTMMKELSQPHSQPIIIYSHKVTNYYFVEKENAGKLVY